MAQHETNNRSKQEHFHVGRIAPSSITLVLQFIHGIGAAMKDEKLLSLGWPNGVRTTDGWSSECFPLSRA